MNTLDTTSADQGIEPTEERGTRVGNHLPEIDVLLNRIRVGFVEVRYEGCNGIGVVTSIKFCGPEAYPMGLDLSGRLRSQMVVFFLSLVESRLPGWKKKAGGFGRFKWDRATGDLDHAHVARRVEHKIFHFNGL